MLISMLKRLTDNYKNNPESNIGKLFNIVASELHEVKNTYETIERYRDVDEAEGYTLDKIGRNVLEYRGTNEDEMFRQLIKTKIRANLSPGDIETINEIMEIFLADEFISVEEVWHNEVYDYEPAAILLKFETTEKAIPFKVAKRIVAGGVKIIWELDLEGYNIGLLPQFKKFLFRYPLTNTLFCGTHPITSTLGRIANSFMELTTDIKAYNFNYKLCGTEPVIKTIGKNHQSNVSTSVAVKKQRFKYPLCGTLFCGQYPS